jgi:hypothetical protein
MKEHIMHYAADRPVVDGKDKRQSPYILVGALLVILGILLIAGIILFYLQTTNSPNGVDFALTIVGVEIQIAGFALIVFNRR